MPQRDEAVLPRVQYGQHAVAALRIRAAHKVRQRVEMRELPREHQGEQCPRREWIVDQHAAAAGGQQERGQKKGDGVRGAREERAADGGPAHEGRDGADDGADPGVPVRAAFHPGVRPRVEGDVGGAEEGRRRIAHRPEKRGAGEAGGGRERGGVRGAQSAPHERTCARARHLRIVGDFLQLVERVGRGAAERGAQRGREQDRDGCGDRGERDAGHGDEHVEGGKASF